MSCSKEDFLEILSNKNIPKPRKGTDLDLLLDELADTDASFPEIKVRLQTLLTRQIRGHNQLVREAFRDSTNAEKKAAKYLLPEIEIEFTEQDIIDINRRNRSAPENILYNENNVVIGKYKGKNKVANNKLVEALTLSEVEKTILLKEETTKDKTRVEVGEPTRTEKGKIKKPGKVTKSERITETITTIKRGSLNTLRDLLTFSKKNLLPLFQKNVSLEKFLTRNQYLFTEEASVKSADALKRFRNKMDDFIYGKPNSRGVRNAPLYGFMGNRKEIIYQDLKEEFPDVLKYFTRVNDSNPDKVTLEFDPALLDAITIAVYDYLAFSAGKLRINDTRTMNQMLGNDDNSEEIPLYIQQFLREGTLQANVIDTIGEAAFNSLGFRSKDNNIDGHFAERAKVAFGQVGLAFLMEEKILQQKKIPREVFRPNEQTTPESLAEQAELIAQNRLAPELMSTMTVLHPEGEQKKMVSAIAFFMKDAKSFKDLFRLGTAERFPFFAPPNKVVETLRRRDRKLPKATRKLFEKLQNQQWELKENVLGVYDNLDKDTIEWLAGIQNDYADKHITERESIEANNVSKQRSIDYLDQFRNKIETENGGENTFYMPYFASSNSRIFTDTNTLDPLQDKAFSRHIMGMKAANVAVDPSNIKILNNFKLAVVQAFGGDIDKQSLDSSLTEFDEILSKAQASTFTLSDGTVVNSLDVIKRVQQGSSITDLEKAAFPQIIRQMFEDTKKDPNKATKPSMHTLEGIIALSSYDSENTFNTNLTIETDAVTSGYALGMLQAVSGDPDDFAAVGIFFNGEVRDFPSWIEKVQNLDAYQRLASIWGKKVKDIKTFIKEDQDLEQKYRDVDISNVQVVLGKYIPPFETNDIIDKEARALAKDPFMITNYGASVIKSRLAVSYNILNKILAGLPTKGKAVEADIRALYKAYTGREAPAQIFRLAPNSEIKRNTPIDPDVHGKDLILAPEVEQTLTNAIDMVYGTTLAYALDQQIGAFAAYRGQITENMTLIFNLFKEYIIDDINAYARKNRRYPSNKEVLKFIDNAKAVIPAMKGPLSESVEDGISFLKMELSRAGINDHQRRSLANNAQFNRDRAIDGNITHLNGTAKTYSFADIGVSPGVVSVHTLDSAIQQAMLTAVEAFGIHDAAIYPLDQVDEGTKAYNEATIRTALLGQYNMLRASYDAAIDSLDGFRKLMADLDAKGRTGDVDARNKYSRLDQATSRYFRTKKDKYGNFFKGTESAIREDSRTILQDMYRKRRALLENRTSIRVSHSAHSTSDSIYTHFFKVPDNFLELPDFLADSLFDQINDWHEKGSSTRGINFENFVASFTQTINAENFKLIYQNLKDYGSKKDTPEHQARLDNVIENILKVQNSIDLKVAEVGSDTFGVQRTFADGRQDIHIVASNPSVKNKAQMSAQEVYAHELSHAVTEAAIDGNSKLRRALIRIFNQVKEEVTWRDFLPDNITEATAEEIKLAKETYDYIFNNKHVADSISSDPKTGYIRTKKQNNYLHEFVAYGLTNEKLAKKLATIQVKPAQREKHSNIFNQLGAWFLQAVEYLSNRILGINNVSADKALQTLVGQMMTINEQKAFSLLRTIDIMGSANTFILDKLNSFILLPMARYRERNVLRKKGVLGNTLYILSGITEQENYVQFGKTIKQTLKLAGASERNVVFKLAQELIGRTKTTNVWHSMVRLSNKVVDQARNHIAANVVQHIQESFRTGKLSKEENEALFYGFVKPDLSSLIDTADVDKYSIQDISDMLSSNELISNYIDGVEKELLQRYKRNGWYYIHQARGLANLNMLGTDFARRQQLNGYNIAQMRDTNREPTGDLVRAEKLIEELKTLYSLRKVLPRHKATAKVVIDRELAVDSKDNGIINLLSLQKLHKVQSREQLFKNNSSLMHSGYVKEAYSADIDIKFGLLEDKEAFEKEGYTLYLDESLTPDALDTSQPRYMYISTSAGNPTYVKSVVSLTSKQAFGTTLEQIYGNIQSEYTNYFDAVAEARRITASTNAEVEAQFRSGYEPSNDNKFIPIMNEEGKPVSYRYMMSDHLRTTLLGRDVRADYAIGRMFASITDKTNSEEMNNQALALLKEDSDANFASNPSAFIILSDESSDSEVAEIYKLLPKETKAEIKRIWGNNPVYVREEVLNLVFGFRKFRATHMDNFVGHALQGLNEIVTHIMRNTFFPGMDNVDLGKLWGEFIVWVKDLIVIRLGIITLPNLISNQFLLWAKDVSISEIGKYESEALIELSRYMKDVSRRDIIARTLEANDKLSTVKRNKLEVELARLEDDISNNAVSELVDEGLFQSIIEDIQFEEDIFSSRAKLADKADQLANKYLHEYAVSGYKHLMFTKDTVPYKMLLKTTQYSDFIARYALFKSRMDKAPKELMLDKVKIDFNAAKVRKLLKPYNVQFTERGIVYKKRVVTANKLLNILSKEDWIDKEGLQEALVNIGQVKGHRISTSLDQLTNEVSLTNASRDKLVKLLNATQLAHLREFYRAKILAEAVDTFVNYDIPTSREMQYINDIGLFMFTKFLFRIQRVILSIFKDRPANAISIAMLQQVIGDYEDIGDSFMLFIDPFGRMNTPMDLFDTGTDIPALSLLT